MTETNYPYGAAERPEQPGGRPPHGSEAYGYGEDPAASAPSANPVGPAPSAPTWGPAPTAPDAPPTSPPSPAPPTSASSAPSAPWGAPAPSAPGAPTSGQGAPSLSAAQAGATLRKVGIGNPLPTFAVGVAAYVVALVASVLVIVSLFLAALTLDTGDVTGGAGMSGGGSASPSDGLGWRGFVGLVGIPFQLVSLATFGSYGMELDLGFFGSMAVGWRGLPLLITVAMVATAFLATRFVQRRWGSNGVLGAVLWSGVSGLAVAIFAVIATRVTAFSYEDDSLGASLSMHSAGADMFFGTWLLIGLPLLLGHIAGGEKPSWWPLVADLAAAPRLALIHALAFALPIGALMMVGGVLGMLVEGEGSSVLPTILSLPLWGLSGLALLAGMGMLVVPAHLTLKGGVEEFGVDRTDEFLWFFDLPWYVWIPMVLLALLLPAAVALLWHRDRELDDGNILALVASWAALPLAYFAGSVVLLALVWTSMQAEMGMMGDVVARIGLAPWMPLIAFFIGLTVEVLARFGAPFVDRFVPGILVNWFRRSARTRRAESQAAPTP